MQRDQSVKQAHRTRLDGQELSYSKLIFATAWYRAATFRGHPTTELLNRQPRCQIKFLVDLDDRLTPRAFEPGVTRWNLLHRRFLAILKVVEALLRRIEWVP